VVAALAAYVAAAAPVDYCAADGTLRQTNATVVASSASAVTWSAGWYAVTNDVTLAKGVTCSGAVNLILGDGVRLTVTGEDDKDAVAVLAKDAALAIYGQRQGTGTLQATGGYFGAGIGVYPAGTGESCHMGIGGTVDNPGILVPIIDPFGPGSGGADPALTINGGTVRAMGGDYGAGIGGRSAATNTSIVVNGGLVTAAGGWGGAGIGGGSRGKGKSITINGGLVTATGNRGGSGIGGGAGGDAGDITIRGGLVRATGGTTGSGIGAGGVDMHSGALHAGTCGNVWMALDLALRLGTSAADATARDYRVLPEIGDLVNGNRYCEASPPDIVVPSAETGGGELSIPYAWFADIPRFVSPYGSDFSAAALLPSGKTARDGTAMKVWQDYVAGTDPTDTNDVFRAFVGVTNGVPYVWWMPNLNGRSVARIYTVSGRTALDVGDWQMAQTRHRFFKVSVAMPTGVDGEVTDAAGVVVDGVQLWENGPYWAKCNVGATRPEEYGYYFWWGDTVGYKRNPANDGWVSVKDGASFSFNRDNCPTDGKNKAQLLLLGCIDETGNLLAERDAATAHWGAPWRMPTDTEMSALISNCTNTWAIRNGVSGRLVTGRGAYASKSIFLPAAGYGNGSSLSNQDLRGYYWSSTPGSDYLRNAWCLDFESDDFYWHEGDRFVGRSVRPVRECAK